MRIGYGYAVACTGARKKFDITLGGVEVPWLMELTSFDGAKPDIVSRAVGESIIGAAGLGDLKACGLTPSEDMSDYEVLKRAMAIVREKSYSLGNIDVVILMQENIIGGHLDEVKASLSKALGCDVGQINLKSADERWMGTTGHGRGITATAVSLLENR